jgi:hypothetical protein
MRLNKDFYNQSIHTMPNHLRSPVTKKNVTGNQRIMNLYNKNAPILEKWLNFNSGDNAYAKHMQSKEEACWNVLPTCSQTRVSGDSTPIVVPDSIISQDNNISKIN